MPAYTVNHGYRSYRDGIQYGPYEAGTVIELTEADAEWLNRDSPGALTPVTAEPEREARPAVNRQHKPTANRAAK